MSATSPMIILPVGTPSVPYLGDTDKLTCNIIDYDMHILITLFLSLIHI